MFQIIKNDLNIPFSKFFTLAAILSVLCMGFSIYWGATRMNYGVDFRGGAEIQLKSSSPILLDDLRSTLEKEGFRGTSAQTIGAIEDNEYLIKVLADGSNLSAISEQISAVVAKNFQDQNVEVRKVDVVGPKAGKELRTSAFLALLWAMLAIMVYLGLRFDFKYSPGAVVALLHDSCIIIGFYAFTQTEFTLQTIAAILAVIGYSVNDSVVIYDRVREHEQKFPNLPLRQLIDKALNETLSRTILTAGFTLSVCIIMWVTGGNAIKDFFQAMSVGIIVGTYSSIFVATPFTILIDRYFMKKKVEVIETPVTNA